MTVPSDEPSRRLTEDDVFAVLDGIIDPCSANAGAPAGLGAMGLVHSVAVRADMSGRFDIEVVLGLTEPGCLMGWTFQREAQERLEKLASVGAVKVRLDTAALWTEERLDPSYRAKLAERRRTMLESIKGRLDDSKHARIAAQVNGAAHNTRRERQ